MTHSDATKNGIAKAKATGRRYCHHAPRGFRWAKIDRKWVVEPNPAAQHLIAKILAWKDEGRSVEWIFLYLRDTAQYLRGGKPISRSYIQRTVPPTSL